MTKEQDNKMYEDYVDCHNENLIAYNSESYKNFKIGYKKALNIHIVGGSVLKPQLCIDCKYQDNNHKSHHSKCEPCYFYKDTQQSNFVLKTE